MSYELDIQFPKVRYDAEDQNRYRDLVGDDWSPFRGFTRAEVFIVSMAHAFARRMEPVDLPPKTLDLPERAFSQDMRTLMRSLAIHVNQNVYVLKNNREVVGLCERYANAAIKTIYNDVRNRGSDMSREDVLENIIKGPLQ